MKRYTFFILFFVLFVTATAQHTLKGKVIDEKTKEALAFVNILTNQKIGATTNIDGLFTINSTSPITSLKLSYVGYEMKEIDVTGKTSLVISLKPTSYQLSEFTLLAGENPAHRIINKVVENRNIHNPEKSLNFKYESYNKLFVTGAVDTAIINHPEKIAALDSSSQRAIDFLEKHHIFLMESVTERKYLLPDKSYEKVMASRVSGLQNNTFSLIATEIQSFSFYNEMLNVGGSSYLNPISVNSINKYFFLIEDTTFSGIDTVYVISFRPKKGKNFSGLKGLLYINTDGYAVQNVVAEPNEESESFGIKIQQQYEKIENRWFPVQLNTTILFNNATINNFKMLGIGKSYIKNIEINPELKKNEFGIVATEVADDVTKKDEEFWNKYREDTLSDKERATYHVIDSLGKAEKFDKKLIAIEAFLTGKFRVGFVDLDLDKFLSFNDYEGFRFGTGMHTNNKVSRLFSVGGYGAFGTKDNTFKYGGDVNFFIHKNYEIELNLSYQKDVIEPGNTRFYTYKIPLMSAAGNRFFYMNRMNNNEKVEARLQFRTLRYLKVFLFTNQESVDVTSDYYYLKKINDYTWLHDKNYLFNEIGVELKYAFKQKVIQTTNYKYAKPTKYPILYARIEHGLNNTYNEYEYTRITVKTVKTFEIKNLGKPSIYVESGIIFGDAPIQKLNSSIGLYIPGAFLTAAELAFETMYPYEFYSDRFTYIHFKHNFGNLLIKTKKFKPELVLASNIGFGSLNNKENHGGQTFNTLEKGFYESGILINNLIKLNFTTFGVAAYYRYGPYKLQKESDNFTVKMSFGYLF
ncbi:MAG: carboxypeptidase-like regulatory domain-containing protein [Bacteroidetes bacterium]|nr:carboxypeptidase-like regulatory domain-containing protein [Bacteroidota bacterium]